MASMSISVYRTSALPSFADTFIRLRPNTLQLAAGMKGKVNRVVARQSEGGFGFGAIPL
jgi:hypothetical protein